LVVWWFGGWLGGWWVVGFRYKAKRGKLDKGDGAELARSGGAFLTLVPDSRLVHSHPLIVDEFASGDWCGSGADGGTS
jgi:hypothetical protein